MLMSSLESIIIFLMHKLACISGKMQLSSSICLLFEPYGSSHSFEYHFFEAIWKWNFFLIWETEVNSGSVPDSSKSWTMVSRFLNWSKTSFVLVLALCLLDDWTHRLLGLVLPDRSDDKADNWSLFLFLTYRLCKVISLLASLDNLLGYGHISLVIKIMPSYILCLSKSIGSEEGDGFGGSWIII